MLFLISVNDISLNLQSFSAPSKTDDAVKKPNTPIETREEVWRKDFENLEKSSMAKLRRLLEIEEMAKFSQNLRFWNDLSQICHKLITFCCDEVDGLLRSKFNITNQDSGINCF